MCNGEIKIEKQQTSIYITFQQNIWIKIKETTYLCVCCLEIKVFQRVLDLVEYDVHLKFVRLLRKAAHLGRMLQEWPNIH